MEHPHQLTTPLSEPITPVCTLCTCRTCGKAKPLDTEHWYYNSTKKRYFLDCKACAVKAQARRRTPKTCVWVAQTNMGAVTFRMPLGVNRIEYVKPQ